MASLKALPSSNLSSGAGKQALAPTVSMWIPSGGDPSRAPVQAPPALPLMLMGTSSGEQPQPRHEASPQHSGPQRITSTPTPGAGWGPGKTLPHQPSLHRGCWGAAPRLCRQNSPLSSSWGTQPLLQLLGKELSSTRARHCLPEFPWINILPGPVSPLWLPELWLLPKHSPGSACAPHPQPSAPTALRDGGAHP